jgi:hypothetical protein
VLLSSRKLAPEQVQGTNQRASKRIAGARPLSSAAPPPPLPQARRQPPGNSANPQPQLIQGDTFRKVAAHGASLPPNPKDLGFLPVSGRGREGARYLDGAPGRTRRPRASPPSWLTQPARDFSRNLHHLQHPARHPLRQPKTVGARRREGGARQAKREAPSFRSGPGHRRRGPRTTTSTLHLPAVHTAEEEDPHRARRSPQSPRRHTTRGRRLRSRAPTGEAVGQARP